MIFFTKRRIDELESKLSREELIRRSRILLVDDERPEFIEDITRAGLSVDYVADINQNNMDMVEKPTYDLIILDFGGVGSFFGSSQGLALLRHIKRVNPAVVVFAYTSMSLSTEHADFFRLVDGVLPKDAGIGESLEKIEDGLRASRKIANLWKAFLHSISVEPNSKEDLEWQDRMVRSLGKPKKLGDLRASIVAGAGNNAVEKAATVILEKLIESGVGAVIG